MHLLLLVLVSLLDLLILFLQLPPPTSFISHQRLVVMINMTKEITLNCTFHKIIFFLVIIISGKCGAFARIRLPPTGVAFNSSVPDYKDPKEDLFSFVSSAVYDPTTSAIYYAYKSFNAPTAFVNFFNPLAWGQPPVMKVNLTDMERDTDLILVLAKSTTIAYLVVIGSGSDRVERYTIANGNDLIDKSATLLEDEVDRAYSALYYDPYIYMATYEPDGKLARLNINNFCSLWCSSHGYCQEASCVCKTGYTNDATQGCIASTETTEPASIDVRVVSLAIVSGVAIVIAIIGWILWFKNKGSYQQIK